MSKTVPVIVRLSFLIALVAGVSVVACQQPPGLPRQSLAPQDDTDPGTVTPIAPAIEPEPTGPDPTLDIPDDVELPSIDPVAPAIEPQTQPDPTVDLNPN